MLPNTEHDLEEATAIVLLDCRSPASVGAYLTFRLQERRYGFKELGIWSKPEGAPFLCVEPWHGFASPSDFDGEFSDKPGLMHIAPAETRILRYLIHVGQAS
jgi:hypothetical protein